MSKVFLNYRRSDAASAAGRLYDYLARAMPRSEIFMDVDAMRPGRDFVEQIEQHVGQCDALLAVMGPHWLRIMEEKAGADRDFVRTEIACALKREIPVIPVLVDGATLPDEGLLPDDLKPLARRHCIELRHSRFTTDADTIVSALRPAPPKQEGKWRTGVALVALIVALCLAGITTAWLWIGPAHTGKTVASVDRAPAGLSMDAAKDKLASRQSPSVPLPSATITSLAVKLGDTREKVKTAYPMAADAGRGDLSLPLDGIMFFFNKSDGTLENVRVDSPFIGNVRGIQIGTPAAEVVQKLGQPSYTRGDSSYFYRVDGAIIRFDLNKNGQVETIFQLLDRSAAR